MCTSPKEAVCFFFIFICFYLFHSFSHICLIESRICLPTGWIPTLLEVDQRWIAKALFRWSRFNQPELDHANVDRMWWYPPRPSLTSSAMPALEQFFGHPLLLWMPRKLWRVRLLCPHPDCGKSELTSVGLHQRVRQVVGVSDLQRLWAAKRAELEPSQVRPTDADVAHHITKGEMLLHCRRTVRESR